MNPFDLAGPSFLAFYACLLAVVLFGVVHFRKTQEAGEPSKLDLSDPYLVAYLRGGANEAIRVAVINLVDRGLLTVDKTKLCRTDKTKMGARVEPKVTEFSKKPNSACKSIERAILDHTASPLEAASLFNVVWKLNEAFASYETLLRGERLIPGGAQAAARALMFLVALGIILGIGMTKVAIAIDRGHRNIGFLVMLMIGGVAGAALTCFPRLTEKGRLALADLKSLYSGLHDRAASIQPGGGTIEAAMLAAVFGLTALHGRSFAYSQTLFPRASQTGSSCGSSCGSGGGCGGGGCGGCGS